MDITNDLTSGNARAVAQPVLADLCTLDGECTQVVTDLTYDAADPFAVTLVFRATPRPVRWTFARGLLAAGLWDPTGDGDVHVWSCLDDHGAPVVMVELCSPDGDVLVQLATPEVVTFLDRTEAVVPTGTEAAHLDLDAVIAAVLTDAL